MSFLWCDNAKTSGREAVQDGGGRGEEELQTKAKQLLGGCAVIIEPPQLRELFELEVQ